MAASTSCKKKSNSPSPGGPSLLPHPCESKTTEGEAMVANGSVAMCDEQVQNGLEFLLDPVDRLRIGHAPPDRVPCAGRVTPLEETIRRYANKPSESAVKPEIGET
ncbi:uncharacterized protein [Triticum aestivum]|uniref:uncharacterized protein isoform X2 n=1 Tax=Triticum aestivum TaxID=4565 RepID=UPI001D018E2B|nr:uncharacterized protein LOC123121059 isoform X2 [Triticum aestivum]